MGLAAPLIAPLSGPIAPRCGPIAPLIAPLLPHKGALLPHDSPAHPAPLSPYCPKKALLPHTGGPNAPGYMGQ